MKKEKIDKIISGWNLYTSDKKPEERKRFVEAYKNRKANRLVKRMMLVNYTDAVMTYHPDSDTLDEIEVRREVSNLVHTVFDVLNTLVDYPEYLNSFFNKISRHAKRRSDIWFEQFIEAYSRYRYKKKLENRYSQLEKYFKGGSFVDVGTGGGEWVKMMMEKRGLGKEKAAGIDPYNWLSDSVKDQESGENLITFYEIDFSKDTTKAHQKYDFGTCLATIHHVAERPDIAKAERFIRNMGSAFKSGGILVVEEDVLVTDLDLKTDEWRVQVDNLRKKQPFYDEFLGLNNKDQWSVLTLIDFMANVLSVGEPSMPFPAGFRSISEWKNVFERNGFLLKSVEIIGNVKHNFNQTSHAFFILKKL